MSASTGIPLRALDREPPSPVHGADNGRPQASRLAQRPPERRTAMNTVSITVVDEVAAQVHTLAYPCSDGPRLAQVIATVTTLLSPGQHITSIDVA
jgi:hypothetical protein